MIEAPEGPHQFHIPVMGTGFTIDTPVKVAPWGISSVLSLVDDILIEQMSEVLSKQNGRAFEPVDKEHPDPRAERIRRYLDLVVDLVDERTEAIRNTPFTPGSPIVRWFEQLPQGRLHSEYRALEVARDPEQRAAREHTLRRQVRAGAIDVNIMTKLDANTYGQGPRDSDAQAALRGFAASRARGSVVFSAGLNSRLYGYLEQLEPFHAQGDTPAPKGVILKVSDFRSAQIQAKLFAKRGIWIREFRVESGINCGGHAFVSAAPLLGPTLEQFQANRADLVQTLFELYGKALEKNGRPMPSRPPGIAVTVQGGIGTAAEQRLLMRHYGVDGTGWGTPFLLVPEATTVDDQSLQRLLMADEGDVRLSSSSPMGVPFWNLMTSSSEVARRERLRHGRPGSRCPKGFIATNDEFGTLLCPSSRGYQRRRLAVAGAEETSESERLAITAKSCICHDLGGVALLRHGIDGAATPALCPGPNLTNFKATASLRQMIDHIYGRDEVKLPGQRPHMLLREVELCCDHALPLLDARKQAKLLENFELALQRYQQLLDDGVIERPAEFARSLGRLRERVRAMSPGSEKLPQTG